MGRVRSYIRRHHVGLLALFIALGGTSYAAATGSIDSREIKNNSVRGQDVRNNSLTGRDLRDGAVGSQDVRDGRLLGADVRDGSLGGEDLRDSSLGDSDLAPNSVSDDELRSGSVRSGEVRDGSLRASDLAGDVLRTSAVVRFETVAIPAGGAASEDVSCTGTERALGGGVSFADTDPDDRVTLSEPRVGSSRPSTQARAATAWRGAMFNGGAAERTATVWAVCASR